MKRYWLAGSILFLFATVSSVSIATDEQLTNLLSLDEGTLLSFYDNKRHIIIWLCSV
jgi:hypothetical protein